jgi:lysophospholipase L1-like esterase
MKYGKLLSIAIIAAFLFMSIPVMAQTSVPGDDVRVQINGVNVYSPLNHLWKSTSYVDVAAYAKLTNVDYEFNAKNSTVKINDIILNVRIYGGTPTTPIRPLAEAAGAELVSWDGATKSVYVLDLPEGTVQLASSTSDTTELWADPKDMTSGPIYGVEDEKLVFLEYRVDQETFVNGKNRMQIAGMKGLPSAAIDHTDIKLETPHYVIQQYFVSHKTHLAFGTAPQGEAGTVETAKLPLVALGDSIPFGFNLEETDDAPSPAAFPYLIGGGTTYDTTNLAVSGWDSTELLEGLQTAEFQEALQKADIVTLNIGSNDLFGPGKVIIAKYEADNSYQPSEADKALLQAGLLIFENNFPVIVSEIRKHTDAPIVIYTLYNPFPELLAPMLYGLAENYLPASNDIIKATAAANANTVIADAYTKFEGKQISYVLIRQYDIHPTRTGQRVLAALADEAIQSLSQD